MIPSSHETRPLLPGSPANHRMTEINVLRKMGNILLLCTAMAVAWHFSFHEASAPPLWTVPPRGSPNERPLDAAYRILKHAPVIDTHNDWPGQLNYRFQSILKDADLNQLPATEFHTDIYRLRQGRVGAQFWSAYVGCTDFNKQTDVVLKTLEQIDLIKRFVAKYPAHFALARSSQDIRHFAQRGKIASLIGIEGGHQIDSSMAVLRQYHELGVRYMTLTHSCHTSWADSCTPAKPIHNGISPDGHRFIREMNRLGMMVDLSHVSADAMRQAINASRAPVVFSHSNAFGVTPVPRNVPDDVLRLVAARDGVVMVNFLNPYVVRNGTVGKPSVVDLGAHMQYMKEVAGGSALNIGIGADFDGGPLNDFALTDVSKYPELVAELLRRGFTEKEIVGITGSNLLRVMEKVEKVAMDMRKDGESVEEIAVKVVKLC